MKLRNIMITASLALIVVAMGTSCKKDTFNINKNPNQPTDSTVSYNVILPSAEANTGSIIALQWGTIQNWMGYWARSGTYAPSVTEETYQITTSFGNGVWNSCYDNLYDYQIMQTKATAAGADFYAGIARIMKAHDFQILVDVYGNVPYSEALKGNGNTTPEYDKGIDIYKDLFRQLDTAITLIKGANSSDKGPNADVLNTDIIFGTKLFPQGSLTVSAYIEAQKTRWIKFANTLKLKMLVHAYYVTGFPISDEVAKIEAEGSGYMGAGLNAEANPGYASDKPNPFYDSYIKTTTGAATANNIYYAANDWGINYYAYNGDVRESRFYKAGGNGLVGVAYGLPPTTANAASNLASIGDGVGKTYSSNQAILTAAESLFLQAEARQRGIITTGPTAAALLASAITENFTYVGATAANASSYISGNAGYPDVDITAAALAPGYPAGGIFTILSQKWFALNAIDPLEVWTDYRRVPYSEVATSSINDHFVYGAGVGYDAGPPISVAPQNTSTKIPVRYLYPQTEYNYNPANVGAEGTINQFTSRIFWDIN